MKGDFRNWTLLLRHYLKRDWKIIGLWVIGMGAFAGGFLPAFVEIGKDGGLAALYETMKNPAMIALCGPTPVETGADYTVGAMYSHMMLAMSALIQILLAALFVVSHTRGEEERGLGEFALSYGAGRLANALANLVEMVLINFGVATLTFGCLWPFKETSITTEGIVLFAFSIAMAGMIGAVIAFFFAQVFPTASTARGVSLGVIAALYLLRAVTDIENEALSMVNPMGWTYITYPFTTNDALPLLYGLVFSMVLAVVALAMEKRHDMGMGYVRERNEKQGVSPLLLSEPGFLWRINRAGIIGWVLTFGLLGACYGSIYGSMETFLNSNELIQMMFTTQGVAAETFFTATILLVLEGLAMIVPVFVIGKLYTEETSTRLGLIYATKTSRAKLYLYSVLLAGVASVAAAAFAAWGLGATALAVTEDCALSLADFVLAGLNYLPAILVSAGLAAFLLGWCPKWGKAVYVYIVYSFMLNYLGGVLNLPDAMLDIAALSWVSTMPLEDFDARSTLVLLAVAAALFDLGFVGYLRRDEK